MQNLVVRIPRSNVFRFGDSNAATPLFRALEWTVKDGENWAVVGSSPSLLKILTGNLRISPPPPPPAGLFPFLTLANPPRDPYSAVSLVSFANRQHSSTGAFYDYTARYGALRDEDRITLRQSIYLVPVNTTPLPSSLPNDDPHGLALLDELADRLELTSLLDLPLVALSNGQTRRARILKALLGKPELLLLDEPLTGLDTSHRPNLLALLHSLHTAHRPRIIISLRPQDPIPEWITHIALVRDGHVTTGLKNDVFAASTANVIRSTQSSKASQVTRLQPVVQNNPGGKVLVDMKNVNVQYQDRKVLNNINWEIHEGERWHLQGANGSGKTTLLSILTGDHPQSYIQRPPHSILSLFSYPRTRLPTVRLRTLVGTVSPELAAAFPRRSHMHVWDVVGTGFDGTFISQGRARVGIGMGASGELGVEEERWRVARVWDVLRRLGPRAWTVGGAATSAAGQPGETERTFASCDFAELGPGERAIVLLARALVGRPPLLLLDEPWSGMEPGMVEAARTYLREGEEMGESARFGEGVQEGWKDQSVVVVGHWESEVPWTVEEGLKVFRLEAGRGRTVQDSGT